MGIFFYFKTRNDICYLYQLNKCFHRWKFWVGILMVHYLLKMIQNFMSRYGTVTIVNYLLLNI